MRDKIASSVFAAGIPAAVYTILHSFCNILMNNKMSAYGDLAVAGIGAALNIIAIAGIVATGIGNGIQPLLGYQIGTGNKKKFKEILKYALVMTVVVTLAITVLCYIFTDAIIGVFVSGEEAASYGVSFAKILLLTGWLYCLLGVCSTVIQTTGRFGASLAVSLSRNGYIFVPTLLLMDRMMGMYGIVWSITISDVICIIIAMLFMARAVHTCFAAQTPQNNKTVQDQAGDEPLPPVDNEEK